MPSSMGRWKALRPLIRPMPPARLLMTAVRTALARSPAPDDAPPGVRREVLPPDVEPIDEEGPRDRLIGGSLTTLLYMTQLAAISQDPWFSRMPSLHMVDHIAFDLDPMPGTSLNPRYVTGRFG